MAVVVLTTNCTLIASLQVTLLVALLQSLDGNLDIAY